MPKILIVNDSLLHQKILLAIFELQPQYEIVAVAANGYEAIEKCQQTSPDLVIMDIHMPGLDGLQATKKIMKSSPTRILIVTATINVNMHFIFEAQAHGAMDVAKTPQVTLNSHGSLTKENLTVAGADLLYKIDILLKIPIKKPQIPSHPQRKIHSLPTVTQMVRKVVAIGASTGGPNLIKEIISQIPSLNNTAIIIIQHIMEDFAASFADWLSGYSAIPVQLAQNKSRLSPQIFICPGGKKSLQLQMDRTLALVPTPSHLHHTPNIDILFSSVAKYFAKNSMGIILSGMGNDGAQGLLQMRQNGAYTICQRPDTCIVDSMPVSAQKLGACKRSLTPCEIVEEIIKWKELQ